MTLVGHLSELRGRLIKSVIALAVTTLFSLLFTRQFLALLIAPMGESHPVALRPTETIISYFRIALISGLVLAMPVIVYQLLRFVLPGLTRKERRYVYFLVPGATLSFAAGVAFAALVMLPFAVGYLKGFLSDLVQPTYSLEYYISFVTTLLLWVGIIFETPLMMFFLAKIGLINARQLSHYRKYAVLVIAIVAAVITPTPDPFNMSLVMGPLWILYEIGILLAKLAA